MTKLRIVSVAVTTAFALAAAGTPAAARGVAEGNVVETVPSASSPPVRQKRYCVVTTVTGSRLPTKICKTRQEWEAQGVEIPGDR